MIQNENDLKSKLSNIKGIVVNSINTTVKYYSISLSVKTTSRLNGSNFILDYSLGLDIPKNFPSKLPKVYERCNHMDKHFGHINDDNSLCLGTDLDIMLRLQGGNPLYKLTNIIIEYLTLYEYWNRYSIIPSSDRSHYNKGIEESYQELFGTTSRLIINRLINYIPVKNKYRNIKCPCESGKKFKNCHFNILKKISSNKEIIRQVKSDAKNIL